MLWWIGGLSGMCWSFVSNSKLLSGFTFEIHSKIHFSFNKYRSDQVDFLAVWMQIRKCFGFADVIVSVRSCVGTCCISIHRRSDFSLVSNSDMELSCININVFFLKELKMSLSSFRPLICSAHRLTASINKNCIS